MLSTCVAQPCSRAKSIKTHGSSMSCKILECTSLASFAHSRMRRQQLHQLVEVSSAHPILLLEGRIIDLSSKPIIYFDAPCAFNLSVQGSSAIKSAYQNLALLLGVTVTTILSGVGATLLGYTVPFMVFGSVLFTIGCGLVHTLTVGSPTREWIGYQLLAAFGAGFGLTLPVIAVQSVVPTEDIPVGSALVAFSQLLGGALSVAIAQNVFFNSLTSNLLPLGISAAQLQAAGASNLAKSVPAHLLPAVLQQYANALQTTFIVPIAGAAAAFLVSFGIEWVNIKGKKMDMTAAA